MRLDLYLVEHRSCESRARAQAAIKAGNVRVNGTHVRKPSQNIHEGDEVIFEGEAFEYVSRGGLKLEGALGTFEINPKNKTCLDLGASTGGFTDVLLRAGATRVYAVDVGHGQLHAEVAINPNVINLERTHARDLTTELIPEAIEILVCDVSFISLKKALPSAMALCAPGAKLVALIKPQFEVGRSQLGKGGIVKPTDENSTGVALDIQDWLIAEDWTVNGWMDSPITGSDGNREFLISATNKL